jgi:hypothetical protein
MRLSLGFLLSGVVVMGWFTSLDAQTSSHPSAAAPVPMTLTGCVDRADDVEASAAGAADVDSLSFVLTHAVKGAGAELKSESVGTSGRSVEPVKGATYRLDAPAEKLNGHVGHKVEVTGTLDTTAPPSTGDTTPTPAPKVKVASVKMIDATCAR